MLITGGSGLIGRHLARHLQDKDYEVAVLTRKKSTNGPVEAYFWDPGKDMIDEDALRSSNAIIHLAGVNIGEKRWTAERKLQIQESRVKSGDLLFNHLKKLDSRPKVFITASAIGYYGAHSSENIFKETDPPAGDFLGDTCRKWEAVADRIGELGIRTVKIRTGIVLTAKGGALSRISLPVKLGIGSALGDGRQYMPWIHMEDLCNIYERAIVDSEFSGAYNAVAPEHITNYDFTRILARHLHRPFWFPRIPAFALRLAFGELSVMILEGSRVSSEKLLASGFRFQYPDLEGALQHL